MSLSRRSRPAVRNSLKACMDQNPYTSPAPPEKTLPRRSRMKVVLLSVLGIAVSAIVCIWMMSYLLAVTPYRDKNPLLHSAVLIIAAGFGTYCEIKIRRTFKRR